MNASTALTLFSTLALAATATMAATTVPSEHATATRYKAGRNRVSFPSEGVTVVGTLFLPESYKPGQKLAAVIVEGPWTQVKEQVGSRYGEQLAKRGLAALALDHRYYGESGGEPRQFESTREKVKDLKNAVSFLQTVPDVDPGRIALLGVCAGAGIAAKAVGEDNRIRSFATIAAWLQHPQTTPLFYGGAEGVASRIELSKAAREKFAKTGQVDYVLAYDPTPNSGAAMFFPVDYYGNKQRGAVPAWKNQFAVMGWQEWLELDAIDGIADKITVPTLMIHSDGSALPDNARQFYGLLKGPKDLYWTEGEHTQFYDQEPFVSKSADAVAPHFHRTLEASAISQNGK